MVYQHFTLAPGMTVAENLLLAGGQTPALIDWKPKRARAAARSSRRRRSSSTSTPRPPELAAGEKQKLELLKQLYLKPRLLILDEPTSVLTPQEADEVLGHVRDVAQRGECTVLMITHKFREVMAYADDVTVLRRGARPCTARGRRHRRRPQLAAGDDRRVGAAAHAATMARAASVARIATSRRRAAALARRGPEASRATAAHSRCTTSASTVRAGEILGIAGVSGNGQRELVEALVGQRAARRRQRAR